MSKRKRASKPASDDSTDDASVKDDMVHVTPDLLAGSPDVFAGKKAPAEAEPEAEPAAEAAVEPAEPTAPAEAPVESPEETAVEPSEASAALAPPEPAAPPEPVPEEPPPVVSAVPATAARRRGGSSAALGLVLIVIGIFALVVVLAGIDLTQYGWPLFVIIPGLTLLVVGFTNFGQAATIPGGVVTVLGLVLAYQNSTGDWPSWAFLWALIVPGGIGLGMYLQALRERDQQSLRNGRILMFIALLIAAVGFVLFESILGISGRDYGPVGKAALPVLLIVIGVILFMRSLQRERTKS